MTCKICNSPTKKVFEAVVLEKHRAPYLRCDSCGFLFPENPHWLEESYSRPINISDTGIVARNEKLRDALAFVFRGRYPKEAKFGDYAGGYGLLTRMMRDCGFDYYWQDPFTENLFAVGFEMTKDHGPYAAVTCCEGFEHFTDPLGETKKQLALGRDLFFTTTLISSHPPQPESWDYYGFSHGQHVAFYTEKSLHALGEQFGLKASSNGKNFHCISGDPPSKLSMRLAYGPIARTLQLPMTRFRGSFTQADHERMKSLD